MKAAYYERTGPAREVLHAGELPDPVPGPGEVRVRVRASGVNPSDVKSRGGTTGRPLVAPRIVPHSDGAGEIDAVGPDVAASRVGERVWVRNAQWKRPGGTAAEFAVVPAACAHALPEGISYEIGACLGIPLLTAYRAVHFHGGIDGRTVVVHGGAGAVGHYAVQLAKRAGARVIATVSSEEKAAHARDAGADLVVDYRREPLAGAVRAFTHGRGADRILEVNLSANAAGYVEYLARDGSAVVYGSDRWDAPLPLGAWLVHGVRLGVFIVYELEGEPLRAALAETEALLRGDLLIHRVAATYPLERIAEAHEAVEGGHAIGNVVVTIP